MERQGGERARERRENVPETRTWSQRRGNRFQIAIAKLLQIKNWFSSMYPLLVLVARKIIKSTNLAGPSSYSNPLKPELNYSNCGVQIKKKKIKVDHLKVKTMSTCTLEVLTLSGMFLSSNNTTKG